MLGLLPGGGGTQRLPKLTGLPNTLDMALTGKTLKGKKAKSVGLVDTVISPLGPGLEPADVTTLKYLETVSKQIAKDLGNGKMKLPDRKPKNLMKKVEAFAMGITQVKDYVFKTAKGKVMQQTKCLYPAPLKFLEVVRHSVDHGPEKGYAAEAKGFESIVLPVN